MILKTYLTFIFIIYSYTTCYSQSIPISLCDIPIEDSKSLISQAFEIEELKKYDKIVIRNNYFSSCFKSKIDFDKIKIYNETVLYDELCDDFFTIIKFQYTGNSTTLFFINNKNNLFISMIFYKTDKGVWVLTYKSVIQGILKVDDFLYKTIREKKRKL